MSNYTVIGKLNRSFGSEGGIRFTVYPDFFDAFIEKDYIFLLLDGLYVPFFKDKSRLKSTDLIFLDDINNNTDVDEIAGNAIYLPNDDLPELPEEDENLEYKYLKGFKAYKMDESLIGEISKISQYPMQEMAIIEDSETLLIPLNKGLIHKIDIDLKIIYFDLPEGLIP